MAPPADKEDSANQLAFLYPLGYNAALIEIRQTETYAAWFASLRDQDIQTALELAHNV